MKAPLRRPALWPVTLLSSGYVVGRLVGVAVDGLPSILVMVAFAVEMAGAVLGALSLRTTVVKNDL